MVSCINQKDLSLLRFGFLDSFSPHTHLQRRSSSLSEKTGGNKKQSGMMKLLK